MFVDFIRNRMSRKLALACLGCAAVYAQVRVPGTLLNGDLATLETQDPRNDLDCTVSVFKPELGFDLRFHSGYGVSLPVAELMHAGSVAMVFRITSEKQNAEPLYFSQRFQIPALAENARGYANLQGNFDLGTGRYRVDWLLRDPAGRQCSQHWQLDVSLPSKDRDLQLALAPGDVEPSRQDEFRPEAPRPEPANGALNARVLVNFAPQNEKAATLKPQEVEALVSILRRIAREPRIGKISLVAFNLRDQRILYQQDNADRVDFPALGQALQAPSAGTIDVKALSRKNGESEFVASLLRPKTDTPEKPGALILVGLKVDLEDKLSQDSLKKLGDLGCPIFYLNVNSDPVGNPWRDTIGDVVKFFKGQAYTITHPRDLAYAWRDITSRLSMLAVNRRALR